MKTELSHSPPRRIERSEYLRKLTAADELWDIIVIGGGSSGLGIALDAVARGYKTLLVEQSDFAKGTSSRSTKLVHGGVRYLAQGDIRLVREASIERGLLLKNAPHIVKDQMFIVPVYSNWERLKYSIGLKLYDRIAGGLRLRSSFFMDRKKIIEKVPGIEANNLKGGIVYHDGQFDDSRLAINLVQSIWEYGGHAINYIKVIDLLKDGLGKVNGVRLLDIESGQTLAFSSKSVVNATGVFVDSVLQMDNPGKSKTISVSQGVHLVIDKKFYPSAAAMMIPRTSDGRVLFAVPWHDKVLLGTTDTPVNEVTLEPQSLEKEIDFILNTAASYLIKKPTRSDVLSVFAGLRPLAAPSKSGQKTKEISRSHKIIVSPSKLFTILGGKWTTYRKMGEDMIDQIEIELSWPHRKNATRHLPIYGHSTSIDWTNYLHVYGTDAPVLAKLINVEPDDWISKELKLHRQHIIWAIRYEMAITVEDVLARRTRALFLDARESIRIAPEVARIMAETMNRSADWMQQQIFAFTELANQYVLKKI